MQVITAHDTERFSLGEIHFTSYVRPERHGGELCLWQLEVSPGSEGAAHVVHRDELLIVTSGELTLVDGDATWTARAGDVVQGVAGSTLQVGNRGSEPATAWVSTSRGFSATMAGADAPVIPPWAR